MKDKIEKRLIELNTELAKLTDHNILWMKETGGLTRSERISVCKFKIEELSKLLVVENLEEELKKLP